MEELMRVFIIGNILLYVIYNLIFFVNYELVCVDFNVKFCHIVDKLPHRAEFPCMGRCYYTFAHKKMKTVFFTFCTILLLLIKMQQFKKKFKYQLLKNFLNNQ